MWTFSTSNFLLVVFVYVFLLNLHHFFQLGRYVIPAFTFDAGHRILESYLSLKRLGQ